MWPGKYLSHVLADHFHYAILICTVCLLLNTLIPFLGNKFHSFPAALHENLCPTCDFRYKLHQPTKQYAPWCEPVLKTARLAVSIITMLKEQSRASKLSFADVIKKVAEFDKGNPAFISSNIALVERYIVVHGQIILQQFADFPDETIRRSAFATGLLLKMEQRRHTKLVMKKKPK